MNTLPKLSNLISGLLVVIAFSVIVACGQDSNTTDSSATMLEEQPEEQSAPETQEQVMEVVSDFPSAPDFTLPSANTGTEISLSSFQGDKPVVLVFYRAYW